MSAIKNALSFCDLLQIGDFILEVTPHDKIEIGQLQADEYLAFLRNLSQPVAILLNRKNRYSYTFEALGSIAQSENVVALAVLLGKQSDHAKVEYLAGLMQARFPTQNFIDRQAALLWLQAFAKGDL